MWTEKIAKAEAGNVPYGAIFLASLAQALGVLGYGALLRKYPANATLAKWAPTGVGTGGAVLVSQVGKHIGEATAKSMALGLGSMAVSPWIGSVFNTVLYPAPAVPARRPTARRPIARTRIAGRGNPGRGNPAPNLNPTSGMDLNGEAAARDLGAGL